MYEDLAKQLRFCSSAATCEGCPYGFGGCEEKLMKDAAKAIEELAKNSSKLDRGFGEWQADYDGYSDGQPVCDMWWCSECGTYFDEWDDKPTWNFCPNCGAYMRKEET